MSIKIISFNIACADDVNGHSRAERAPRIIDVIKKRDPDLIGLQEFTPRWNELLGGFIEESGYELFNVYRAESNKEGTPMLWKKDKFECLAKGHFWLSDTPEVESKGWDEYGCHRVCLWAKLKNKESGEVFVYVNTHLGFGDKCQTDSVKLILSRIAELGTDAVFITGDFNFWHDTPGYLEITKEFIDVTAATTGEKTATCHGYNPLNALSNPEASVDVWFGVHIDYCFINPKGVTPIIGKVLREDYNGKFPSDHNAVYFEIGLK